MTLREKMCPYCRRFFFYDDGQQSSSGLSGAYNQKNWTDTQQGFCPTCVDPAAVPGETFEKQTILTHFKRYLKDEHEVQVELFEDETIINMMGQFPRVREVYFSNGTYITITLHAGTQFDGEFGRFEIGASIRKELRKKFSMLVTYDRQIRCLRCDGITTYDRQTVLQYYLGFLLKRCRECDKSQRDMSGLNRNGSTKRDDSNRAKAKALNISLYDYKRGNFTPGEPVPHLPIETIVKNLKIVDAYWDETVDIYAPKYKLQCIYCHQIFTCLQKHIDRLDHTCQLRR